jgi:hypothetical protein
LANSTGGSAHDGRAKGNLGGSDEISFPGYHIPLLVALVLTRLIVILSSHDGASRLIDEWNTLCRYMTED